MAGRGGDGFDFDFGGGGEEEEEVESKQTRNLVVANDRWRRKNGRSGRASVKYGSKLWRGCGYQ